MKSGISFFNRGIALNLFKRFWPLWTTYLATLVFVFPVNILSKLSWELNWAFDSSAVYEIYAVNGYILRTGRLVFLASFVFAVLVAMAVFGYLYDQRCCGLMNSLPLRRETVYSTAFITGLAPMLAADLLVWLAAWLVLSGVPNVGADYMLQWLAMSVMSNIAFFGMASFCAGLTGSIPILPALYAVLNVAAWLLEAAVRSLLDVLVYGYAYDGFVLSWLSPVVRLNSCDVESEQIEGAAEWACTYSIPCFNYLIGFCIAGIVLAVLGLLLVRRRRMEVAGDVVAVGWLKPAFKYCMAVGGALTFACAVYECFFNYVLYGVPAALLVIAMMPVGAFIGFFGSEMLMQKSLHVFTKGWKQYISVCCCLTLLALCAEFDVAGYEKRIPDFDDIEYVSVDNRAGKETQPETISLCRELHQKLIDDKAQESGVQNFSSVPINYYLKDGRHICRLYKMDCSDEKKADPDSAVAALNKLYNCPELISERVCPSVPVTKNTIISAGIIADGGSPEGHYRYDTVNLTQEQALDLYYSCILPDSKEGTIGLLFCFDNEEVLKRETNVNIWIELALNPRYNGPDAYKYCATVYVTLLTDSSRTLEWILGSTSIEPMTRYELQQLYGGPA